MRQLFGFTGDARRARAQSRAHRAPSIFLDDIDGM
jgi:hypothetical protein